MDATSVAERGVLVRFGTIVVIGGGCYGSYYLRQLRRGARAGAVGWQALVLVDRAADCAAAPLIAADAGHDDAPAATIVCAEWGAFLDGWLPTSRRDDAIVPSPLMPHLFFEWVARRAAARWPDRLVERAALPHPVGTPWESAAPDGTAYVSHATWMCPVNCIEPVKCPHTRGPRSWSMPETLATWGREAEAAGQAMLGPFTFHCSHRAYGVGMVDAEAILAADHAVAAAGAHGAVDAVLATASHCHGAAARLRVLPPVPPTGPIGEI